MPLAPWSFADEETYHAIETDRFSKQGAAAAFNERASALLTPERYTIPEEPPPEQPPEEPPAPTPQGDVGGPAEQPSWERFRQWATDQLEAARRGAQYEPRRANTALDSIAGSVGQAVGALPAELGAILQPHSGEYAARGAAAVIPEIAAQRTIDPVRAALSLATQQYYDPATGASKIGEFGPTEGLASNVGTGLEALNVLQPLTSPGLRGAEALAPRAAEVLAGEGGFAKLSKGQQAIKDALKAVNEANAALVKAQAEEELAKRGRLTVRQRAARVQAESPPAEAVPQEVSPEIAAASRAFNEAAYGSPEGLPAAQAAGTAMQGRLGTSETLLGELPSVRLPTRRTYQQAFGDASESRDLTNVDMERLFPKAGSVVNGRTVREAIPNTDSIDASLIDSEELPGVREVPMAAFTGEATAVPKDAQTLELAQAIRNSKEINPLIVVVDSKGPYILEGSHRYDALRYLRAKSFPALVVKDTEDITLHAAQAPAILNELETQAAPEAHTALERGITGQQRRVTMTPEFAAAVARLHDWYDLSRQEAINVLRNAPTFPTTEQELSDMAEAVFRRKYLATLIPKTLPSPTEVFAEAARRRVSPLETPLQVQQAAAVPGHDAALGTPEEGLLAAKGKAPGAGSEAGAGGGTVPPTPPEAPPSIPMPFEEPSPGVMGERGAPISLTGEHQLPFTKDLADAIAANDMNAVRLWEDAHIPPNTPKWRTFGEAQQYLDSLPKGTTGEQGPLAGIGAATKSAPTPGWNIPYLMTGDGIKDFISIPKNLLSSLDISAPGTQGLAALGSNPKEWAKAWKPMIRALVSDKAAKAADQAMRAKTLSMPTPLGPVKSNLIAVATGFQRHPLAIRDITHAGPFSTQEERFRGVLAEHLPIIGGLVKRSDAAYTTYLNDLRSSTFQSEAQRALDRGATLDQLEGIAHLVNITAGVGDLPGGSRAVQDILNAGFFAPSFAVSRAQLPLLPLIERGNPYARAYAANLVGKDALGAATLLTLGAISGLWKTEIDPRSANFGQMQIGGIFYDPLAKERPIINLFARIASQKSKDALSGVIRETNIKDIVWNYLTSRFSPSVGMVGQVMTGKGYGGQPLTPLSAAAGMLVPLFIQDIYAVTHNEGLGGAWKALPGAVGLGVRVMPGAEAAKLPDNVLSELDRLDVRPNGPAKGVNLGNGRTIDLNQYPDAYELYRTHAWQVIGEQTAQAMGNAHWASYPDALKKKLLEDAVSRGYLAARQNLIGRYYAAQKQPAP